MASSLNMTPPSLTAGAEITAFNAANLPSSTLAGPSSSVALNMPIPSLAAGANLPPSFSSLVERFLTNDNCPPTYRYPLTGQRGYNAMTLVL